MINWIKSRLSKATAVEELDEAEESLAPVGVRIKPPVGVRVKPADSYVAGYTVDEAGLNTDDEYSSTFNNIKTTGIDPYDTGHIDKPTARKSVPEK